MVRRKKFVSKLEMILITFSVFHKKVGYEKWKNDKQT